MISVDRNNYIVYFRSRIQYIESLVKETLINNAALEKILDKYSKDISQKFRIFKIKKNLIDLANKLNYTTVKLAGGLKSGLINVEKLKKSLEKSIGAILTLDLYKILNLSFCTIFEQLSLTNGNLIPEFDNIQLKKALSRFLQIKYISIQLEKFCKDEQKLNSLITPKVLQIIQNLIKWFEKEKSNFFINFELCLEELVDSYESNNELFSEFNLFFFRMNKTDSLVSISILKELFADNETSSNSQWEQLKFLNLPVKKSKKNIN